MKNYLFPSLDTDGVRVFPLELRKSMITLKDILVNPYGEPPVLSNELSEKVDQCVADICKARERSASVIFMYGAHLIKNGGSALLIELMRRGWITHLATNGAGCIHDWEFAYFGRSTESVRDNVAKGVFGAWRETGRAINLSVMVGALRGLGFGASVGYWVMENGGVVPDAQELLQKICEFPMDEELPARAELLAMINKGLPSGRVRMRHEYKQLSVSGTAWTLKVPFTVHPGIGYDIYAVHPLFNGAAIGRAGGLDFKCFCNSVEHLNDGVVISVGSAIMAPQVFEKSLSIVHNLRFQKKRPIISGHSFYVVDIQEGGNWNWSEGEPPKTNPAYYLRFCKSFSRMGGRMDYVCCDNVAFVHNLLKRLTDKEKTSGKILKED